MTEFRIQAEWDEEAAVWVATSPDVPGLVLQGLTHEDIVQKARLVLPALIEIGVEPEDRLNDAKQYQRFREAARELETDDSPEAFDRMIRQIVPPSSKPSRS